MNVELIVAIFEGNEAAGAQTLDRVRQLSKDKALKLVDGASITKTKDGDVTVQDIGDVTPKRGRVFGAVTGGLVGLVGGPIGAVAGAVAGLATGDVAARLIDYGVSNSLIKDVQNGLQPGSSAVIVYVEIDWVDKAVARLEELGATVTHETLNEEAIGAYLESRKR